MLLFYVNDPNQERIFDGKYVADILKQKIGFGGKLFEYKMMRVEPYSTPFYYFYDFNNICYVIHLIVLYFVWTKIPKKSK